jgi:hypothetical protein
LGSFAQQTSLLKINGSLKGSPQSRIVDSSGVSAQDGMTVFIAGREDGLADLLAGPVEEARVRRVPWQRIRRVRSPP